MHPARDAAPEPVIFKPLRQPALPHLPQTMSSWLCGANPRSGWQAPRPPGTSVAGADHRHGGVQLQAALPDEPMSDELQLTGTTLTTHHGPRWRLMPFGAAQMTPYLVRTSRRCVPNRAQQDDERRARSGRVAHELKPSVAT